MLGEEGHGIRTIVEMAHLTRLDFGIGSAGLMRQALHYVSNRRAFQRSLVDLPVMRNVLADLAGEAETLMWMGLPLALALERAGTSGPNGCSPESRRRWPSIASASARQCSSSKHWSATAATASSRIILWRASTAKRR
jgi:alkylation response protein AidB-like acyl-CoA dehydrogenase